jgi:hypothetical protein
VDRIRDFQYRMNVTVRIAISNVLFSFLASCVVDVSALNCIMEWSSILMHFDFCCNYTCNEKNANTEISELSLFFSVKI